MIYIAVAYLVCSLNIPMVHCTGKSGLHDLVVYLLNEHNQNVLPNTRITVLVNAAIYQIVDVDGANQEFTAVMWMRYVWYDKTLSWNMMTYNFSNVWLPAETIWKPDLVVYNILRFEDLIKSTTSYVKVEYTGRIFQAFPIVYTVSCKLEISMFPFDKQTCTIILGSWLIHAGCLDLELQYNQLDVKQYVPNNEWQLLKTEVYRPGSERNSENNVVLYFYVIRHYQEYDVDPSNPNLGYVHLQFVFHLRRLPMFYIFTLFIPTSIINAVALFGLFTPTQSDGIRIEKVTMGLTTMLTMAVFLMIIAAQTPKDSTTIPLLSLYILMDIGIVTIATLVSILVMKLKVRDLHKIPVSDKWEGFACMVSKKARAKVQKRAEKRRKGSPNFLRIRPAEDSNQLSANGINDSAKKNEEVKKQPSLLWEDICYILDCIALYVHFGLFMVITIVVLLVIPAIQ